MTKAGNILEKFNFLNKKGSSSPLILPEGLSVVEIHDPGDENNRAYFLNYEKDDIKKCYLIDSDGNIGRIECELSDIMDDYAQSIPSEDNNKSEQDEPSNEDDPMNESDDDSMSMVVEVCPITSFTFDIDEAAIKKTLRVLGGKRVIWNRHVCPNGSSYSTVSKKCIKKMKCAKGFKFSPNSGKCVKFNFMALARALKRADTRLKHNKSMKIRRSFSR